MTPVRRKTVLVIVVLILAPGVALASTDVNQFFSQLENQYQLPQGILAKIAKVESGGNPNARNASTDAAGLFQWIPRSWEYASRVLFGVVAQLSERYNVAKAARVTAFALGQAKSQVGGLIQQAKADMITGLYMAHFLGIGGATQFFREYMRNPNADASSIFPKAAQYNGTVFRGRTLAGVLQYFAQKLGQATGSIQVAGSFEDSRGISLAYSYADLKPSDFMPKSYVPSGTDPSRDYPSNYYSGPGTSYNPTTATNQPVSQTLLGQDNTASTTGNPAALLIVQRTVISRGEPIVVSWTSVRTSTAKPCQISQEIAGVKTVVGEGSEGTKVLVTKKEDAAGIWNFTLQCTSSLGAQIPAQSVSVSVQ